MRLYSYVGVCLLISAASCPPPPQPVPPGPDGGGADVVDAACAQLRALGCSEGGDAGRGCEAVMRDIVRSKLTPLSPACVADAGSPDAVRKCTAASCTLK